MKRASIILRWPGIALLAACAFIGVMPTAEIGSGANLRVEDAPAYLDILSAGVQEVARDYDFHGDDDVPSRQVLLTVTVVAAPACGPGAPFLAYGILIDADRNGSTGTTDSAFGELGIDARICATCNPDSGAFESPVGLLTVTTDPGTGATTFKILTTVSELPSVDFDWIAFAQEGNVFCRLPELPDNQHWATRERSLN